MLCYGAVQMPEGKLEKKVEGKKTSAVLAFMDLWMDDYDTVFSDFDPAPYSKRAISSDFVDEVMRRTSEDKDEEVSFRISVPKALRSAKSEATIKRRLREYFSQRKHKYAKLAKEERNKGIIYFIGGVIMLSSFIFLELLFGGDILMKLLAVVMTPLGWFGVWGGTSHLLEGPEQFNKKRELYSKLARAKFEFFSEEELTRLVREVEEAKAADVPISPAPPAKKKAEQKTR